MTNWNISFVPEAENEFKKLDKNLKKRIAEKLDWLKINFDRISPSTLGGEWRGFFKLRIGDWRIIYKVDYSEHLIIIYLIGTRNKIYKKRKY